MLLMATSICGEIDRNTGGTEEKWQTQLLVVSQYTFLYLNLRYAYCHRHNHYPGWCLLEVSPYCSSNCTHPAQTVWQKLWLGLICSWHDKDRSPCPQLDISNEQSTIIIWADTVVCNLILSTVCYAFHCAIDRPNGRIAAICTHKVPGQRVDRLS